MNNKSEFHFKIHGKSLENWMWILLFKRIVCLGRNRRLVCFDMDSTLIQTEVIDELAERAGVGEEVKAITESAMQGELDFQRKFQKDV